MDISGKLFIVAMIVYTTLFCGFIITGIVFSFFKKRPEDKEQMSEVRK